MSKYCTNCGSPMDADAFICPNCGALPSAEPAAFNAPVEHAVDTPAAQSSEPMKAPNKMKWWMIAVPAVLVIAVTLLFTWQALLMLVSPQAALRLASDKTMQAVSSRYERSPLSVLFGSGTESDTSRMQLNADVNYAGNEFSAEVDLRSNQETRQHTFSAAVSMGGKDYGGAFYMDPKFVAASLDFFNDGAYYGITFDSFKEDAAKSILAEYMTPEQIEAFDEVLQSLAEMNANEFDPEMVKPYAEAIEEFMASQEPVMSTAEVTSEGKTYKCDTITYLVEKEAVISLCETLIDMMEEDENFSSLLKNDALSDYTGDAPQTSGIELLHDVLDELKKGDIQVQQVYYVRSGRLVQTDIQITLLMDGEGIDLQTQVHYGIRAESDLSCKIIVKAEGEELVLNLTSSVTGDETTYTEKITVSMDIPDEEPVDAELLCSWNAETEKLSANLVVKADERNEYSFSCGLKQLENGFAITFSHNDILPLLEATGAELPDDLTFSVDITITDGVEITKPEYTNLDKWDALLVQQLQQAIMSQFGDGMMPYDA